MVKEEGTRSHVTKCLKDCSTLEVYRKVKVSPTPYQKYMKKKVLGKQYKKCNVLYNLLGLSFFFCGGDNCLLRHSLRGELIFLLEPLDQK